MFNDTGGPAFPQAVMNDEGEIYYFHDWHGMSLRDYFAAKAMSSMNSRDDYQDAPADVIALDAYALADAMMKARKQ